MAAVLAAAALAAALGAEQGAAPAAPAGPADSTARQSVKPRRVTTRYDDYFHKYSKRYFGPGFDWRLFKAQAMAESDLNPRARSRAGARGLMQLMPSTYALIASTNPHYAAIDDPQSNIGAGIRHDRDLWELWMDRVRDDDRTRFMFGSYNAGEMTIVRARAIAKHAQLDPADWGSVVVVAPKVPRWRYKETLGYVVTIDANSAFLLPAARTGTGGS